MDTNSFPARRLSSAVSDLQLFCLTVGLLSIIYWLGVVVFNLFFHPVAAFPGPFWARTSSAWRICYSTGGRFHRAIDHLHKQYGEPLSQQPTGACTHLTRTCDVVRVAPNELSCASVESWKAIYGPVKKPVGKSEFYEIYGSGFRSLCVGSERNPQRHSRMKRSLAAAFSTKALTEQESIINNCVDRFIGRLGTDGQSSTGLNMIKWFEMLAFDMLGEMAFGESFHCVEAGKSHFWSDLIEEHLYFITILDNLRRYQILAAIGKFILPRLTVSVRNKHTNYSRDKVARRLDSKSPRADFMSHLIKRVQNGKMDLEELSAHTSTLVIAGGETVATFLAATTYHLLTNPPVYKRLRSEIRNRYHSWSDIDATSALKLPYLQAVISEGLRIYPPGSQGFPRTTPAEGIMVDGVHIPGNVDVYTSAWTVTQDERYFHSPFEFKPERWLDPDCSDTKEASQPFSLGPRGCLGRNFAMMEISLILAKMHFRFDAGMVNPAQGWESESHIHVMWWKPSLAVRFFPADVGSTGLST
ncbi:putative cytochrome P450 [Aspergillus steynii IBT 23096]|uniref:Putative cytochrome P450 n=1 Tax=Aspergillus steynii IBT 23096 TaxID=1392250 RepID=A0A2I2GFR0_9EURO|nr:putative cytochrome P450 [Aspergillus steynii IBT 23096]PLB51667.1 putative cytochrome P450 [Aspergillus steynii IBT 23096]